MMSLLRFTSIVLLAIILAACAGPTKKQIAANVESNVIEIPPEAAKQFQIAVQSMGSGKHEIAQKQLIELTVKYPQLSGPYANLGVLYGQQKKWDKAESALTKAIQKNKKNVKAINQLGFVYRQQGKFDEAEKAYQAAIAKVPSFADSYMNMGILCDVYLGKFDRAVKYYKKYQSMQSKPNRQVAGWLIDIGRRQGAKQQVAGGAQ